MDKKVLVGILVVVVVGLGLFALSGADESTTDTSLTTDDSAMMLDDSMEKDDAMMMEDDKMDKDDAMMMEEGVMVGGALMTRDQTIVENALNSEIHTTLVAAVTAADLVETLSGEGPFTVFAPTNAAFEALPAGTVDTLLLPENKDQLTAVLTYHVVAGSYSAEDVVDGLTLTTVQGEELTFSVDADGTVMINDSATVTIADVVSSNGVTHVIDAVLLPPSTQ